MEIDRFQRIRALFVAARGCDPAERERILAAADEPVDVLDEVRELIHHDERASGALASGAPSPGDELRRAWDAPRRPGERESTGFERQPLLASRPQRVGRYEIVGELGRGGMGVVYEAQQERPERRVALKITHADLLFDAYRARLFEREIRTLARLKHPGIADIYDAGVAEDGRPYYVMELVAGETLARLLETRPLSIRARIELFLQVCEAVRFAHRRGVIHRDLKPGNILVAVEREDGRENLRVKLLDFGLARIADEVEGDATRLTEAGRVQGTLPYMSPEQVRGERDLVDVRSDVYALGVVLYEMLTGRLPYELHRSNLAEAARTIAEVEPARPSSIDRALRGDLETILLRALAKEPDRRYPSVDDLARDVQHVLAGEPIDARRDSLVYLASAALRRHRGVALVAAIALVALVAAMAWYARLTRNRALALDAVARAQVLIDCDDDSLLRDAIAHLDRAERLDPSLTTIYMLRGHCFRSLTHDGTLTHDDHFALVARMVADFDRAGTSRALVEAADVLVRRGRTAEGAFKEELIDGARLRYRRALNECPPDAHTRTASFKLSVLDGASQTELAAEWERLTADPVARQLMRPSEDAVSLWWKSPRGGAMDELYRDELEQQFEQRFEQMPRERWNFDELLSLGLGLARAGHAESAIRVLDAVRAQPPRAPDVLPQLAEAYIALGRWHEVAAMGRDLIATQATPANWTFLAHAYRQLGDSTRAREAAFEAYGLYLAQPDSQAVTFHPHHAIMLAESLDRCAERSLTHEVLARADRLHAANIPLRAEIAGHRMRFGDAEGACDVLWNAVQRDATWNNWHTLGVAHFASERPAAAEYAFERAIEFADAPPDLSVWIALSRLRQGRGREALECELACPSGLDGEPNCHVVGEAWRLLGDEQRSEKAWRRVFPQLWRVEDPRARLNIELQTRMELACCLERQGRREDAAQQRWAAQLAIWR